MTQQWWKQAVVYQIYPKSFMDSDGDGYGDINGIISKLDYLSDLGVDVLWLTPIYPSPEKDNGYDISDYYAINPRYGTLEQFKQLLAQVHQRNMKLIMDIVVNHTSTEHEWFKQAMSSVDNPYHDFYIWRDGSPETPPNNWLSKFAGSAWQYCAGVGKYYLHLFDVTQADLNWENPILRQEIYRMMRYWLELGVDGFRLDVINLISKQQSFADDTLLTPTADGRKFYTDGPRIHEYLHEMNHEVFALRDGLLTVGEMSSTTLESCVLYTNPACKELDMVFNFHHLKVDYVGGEKWSLGRFDFIQLKQLFNTWQSGMQSGGGWNALFWSNHDQPRALSRFGDPINYPYESASMLATAIQLMQGTPYIYQGEEIGMTNPGFTHLEQYRDVEALNAARLLAERGHSEAEILAILQAKSRDNARTPIQWDDSLHAGFTSGTPWIEVSANYPQLNAQRVISQDDSIYHYYRKLSQLRKSSAAIVTGEYQVYFADDPQLYVYTRSLANEVILVINNFYGENCNFIFPEALQSYSGVEYLLNNYPELPDDWRQFTLRPYQSVVLLLQ